MVSKRFFKNIGLRGLFFSFLTVLMLSQMVQAGPKGSDEPMEIIVPGEGAHYHPVGTAYHSLNRGFFGYTSVDGTTSDLYGNTSIRFRIGVDLGYSEVNDLLSGTIDLDFNHPVITVGAGASLAQESASDEYTGSYTFFTTITPKKECLIPSDDSGFQSTQSADDWVNAYPNDILENVGDEFVHCREFGSYLIISMTFEYRNAQEKQDIGGYLDVDWSGKVNVSGNLQMVDENARNSVKIRVRAEQVGGDATGLFSIIPNGLKECTLAATSHDSCFQIFENAVAYAKGGYIDSLNDVTDYKMIRLFTERYEDSGPGLRNLIPSNNYPLFTIVSKIALKNINSGWEQAKLNNRRATNVLNYYGSYLSSSEQSDIEDIKLYSSINATTYKNAADYCLAHPEGTSCKDKETEIQSYLYSYDASKLEVTVD